MRNKADRKIQEARKKIHQYSQKNDELHNQVKQAAAAHTETMSQVKALNKKVIAEIHTIQHLTDSAKDFQNYCGCSPKQASQQVSSESE